MMSDSTSKSKSNANDKEVDGDGNHGHGNNNSNIGLRHDINNNNANDNEAFDDYLLSRLGLLSDEIDWPPNEVASDSDIESEDVLVAVADGDHAIGNASRNGSGNGNGGHVYAYARAELSSSWTTRSCNWRARDPLTSILGSNAVVMSDSGLTPVEMAMLDAEDGNHHQHHGPHQHGHGQHGHTNNKNNQSGENPKAHTPLPSSSGTTSTSTSATSTSGSSFTIPISKILAPLLPPKDDKKSGGIIDNDDDARNDEKNQRLDVDVVRKAFDAAAFAVLRGHQRATSSCNVGSAGNGNNQNQTIMPTKSSHDHEQNNPSKNEDKVKARKEESSASQSTSSIYDPPLLLATEAIRASRISSLIGASGKSAPAFLKKNNTIPWFHVPVIARGGGSGGAGGSGGGGAGAVNTTLEEVKAELKEVASSAEKLSGKKDLNDDLVGSDMGGKGGVKDGSNKKKKLSVVEASKKADKEKLKDKEKAKVKQKDGEKKISGKKRSKPSSHDGDASAGKTAEKGASGSSGKKIKLEKGGSKKEKAASVAGKKDKGNTETETEGEKEKKKKRAASAGSETESKLKKTGASSKKNTPGKKRTLTPSSNSSSKQSPSAATEKSSSSSPTSKSKKPGRPPSEKKEKDGSSNNAESKNSSSTTVTTRAVLSAAAAGVFRELNPDYDDAGNDGDDNDVSAAELEMSISKSISTISKLVTPTKEKKSSSSEGAPPTKKKVVDMDEVVSRAKRLGSRVLDNSRGVARRGDQRREFRMDSALSKVAGHNGAGFQSSLGELQSRSMLGNQNPFLVAPAHTLPLVVPNPFVMMNSSENGSGMNERENDVGAGTSISQYNQALAQGPLVAPWKNKSGGDSEWTDSCLSRLLKVLRKGAGHAVLHDREWNDRSFRVANLLQNMAATSSSSSSQQGFSSSIQSSLHPLSKKSMHGYPNYGPHLIVTSSGEDFVKFAAVFGQLGHGLNSVFQTKGVGGNANGNGNSNDDGFPTNPDDALLRVLPYHGSKAKRRQLRKHFGSLTPSPESHFAFLGGLPDSPFHVILTTYSVLFEDYAHFCQIPFQVVVLDEGMSWLGCSHLDPHGKVGKVWSSGVWSRSGKAGVADNNGSQNNSTPWDFSKDVSVGPDPAGKSSGKSAGAGGSKHDKSLGSGNSGGSTTGSGKTCDDFQIGLTARHRILLASNMHAEYRGRDRGQIYKAPVLGLLTFLAPQFVEAIKDDWERSRVFSCKKSMAYIRTMLARMVVVYCGDSLVRNPNDLVALSAKALDAELPLRSLKSKTTSSQEEEEELEKLIKSQKIVHSRKFAVAWFRPSSPIRKELGRVSLDPILTAVKKVNAVGFICEEVVTASALTTSGSGGGVVGLSAYRAAVRCGRCFSSEQGLKHHISTSHAPPGTWLCRSCGGDCGTSQARTHHERSCKVKRSNSIKNSLGGAADPTAGLPKKRGPKKKEVKNPAMLEKLLVEEKEEPSPVPEVKGVWKQADGKYFIKVDGKPFRDEDSDKESPLFFETVEAAAQKHDDIISETTKTKEIADLDIKSDGSQEEHSESASDERPTESEETPLTTLTAAGIASPDLSVIDIKKLPLHVKPLLRDPSQTSRTGGNSKRYVYAYRGVCRQQRKGHDRWQSQISFNGTNHYLGTFDSEWDAAAVYSWAHLILYGEEATKKAAQEGEEAAAAFAQHEKDIADGKIPPPSPKPAKKKKRGAPKKIKLEPSIDKEGIKLTEETKVEVTETKGKALVGELAASVHCKKKRPGSQKEWNKLKTECAMMLSSGTKGTSKATILATRKDIADMSERLLLHNITDHVAGNVSSVSQSFLQPSQSPSSKALQLPASVSSTRSSPQLRSHGYAMLIGLSASHFGWKIEKFMEACRDVSGQNTYALSLKLTNEFGPTGANKLFRTSILSPSFTIGRALKESQNKFLSSVHVNSMLGMPVGNLQCNIGGPDNSCSEMAARIQYSPSKHSTFLFMACNDDDCVTLNGQHISARTGAVPLQDRDVCSVGARVFVFIEKMPSIE